MTAFQVRKAEAVMEDPMANIEYLKPNDSKELLRIMAENKDRATVIAGGTNLIPDMRDGVKKPQLLVDIGDLNELAGIGLEDNSITIGAATTIAEIAESPVIREHLPILSKAAGEIGNPLTRNRATIGGNLANASPCADTAPPLLAFEATVNINDAGGNERTVPIDKFFMGYKMTRLGRGDVMTRIRLLRPDREARYGYTKLGLRKAASICVASVALMLLKENGHIAKARIAFGSVAPQPIRAYALEALLEGNAINNTLLTECDALLEREISPISDIRGTRSYRQAATSAILKRNLLQAWA
jgi:CO/xanthine dehydrogenase FAD-binding subunit